MDALAAHSEGNIYTVVDEKRHIVFLRDHMEPAGDLDLMSSITAFVAILHEGHAASQSGIHDVEEISVP
jgi:hypothetical protein